ncbi:MAG: FKBP-type peptidyl-prolyl cis-trans isomerase [Salinivirgaceae bacterium]
MLTIRFAVIALILLTQTSYSQNWANDSLFKTTPSGLKYLITRQGKGDFPKNGDRVWVHYNAKYVNDSVYDSSNDRGPMDFYLGQGQLIKGWEEGLQLIKPGGAIILIVPPQLAYGSEVRPNIPANSTLKFEIALIQVNKGLPIEPFSVEGKTIEKGKKKLKYVLIEPGSGSLAQFGDNAYIHYTGFLPDGTIFDSSVKKGDPVRITVGSKQVIEGWDLGLFLMKKGTKIKLYIPPKLAYGNEGYKNLVPENSPIILDLEMVDLIPPEPIVKWNSDGKQIIETSSGLKYVIFDSGEGNLILPENIVTVHYSGYFADGKLFDSSVKRLEPIRFPVGIGSVIDGWDEGLQLMRKGSKFQLLIPSNLAYGSQGAPPQIPPDTDLIFDIEVIDVIQ